SWSKGASAPARERPWFRSTGCRRVAAGAVSRTAGISLDLAGLHPELGTGVCVRVVATLAFDPYGCARRGDVALTDEDLGVGRGRDALHFAGEIRSDPEAAAPIDEEIRIEIGRSGAG